MENIGSDNTSEAAEPAVSPSALVIENPVIEKGEVAPDLLQNRAEAVSKIMEEGLAKDKHPGLWEKMGSYTTQLLRDGQPAEMSAFFADQENSQEFSRVAGELQKGVSPKDLLVDQLSNPSLRTLTAIEMVSKIMNESARGGKDWEAINGGGNMEKAREAEMTKRILRTSEILNAGAKVIKIQQEVLTPEEKNLAPTYVQQFDALSKSVDIPVEYQRMCMAGTQSLRAQEIVKDDAVPAEAAPPELAVEEQSAPVAPEEPTASPDVVTEQPTPTPEAETASESGPQKIEKVFGQEAFKKEDFSAAATEINALLEEGTPQATFQAARELAHLKRMGITVTSEKQQKVFEKLTAQREAIRDKGAAVTARYLMFLKYINVITDILPEEKAVIEDGIKRRSEQGGRLNLRTLDLSKLCVNADYLGVEMDYQRMGPYLAEEVEAVNKPGAEYQVAVRLARVKYLKIQNEKINNFQESTKAGMDVRLGEYASKGRWGAFARLKRVVNYFRGEPTNIADSAQTAMVEYVAKRRKSSEETGKWTRFMSYAADIVGLSKQKEASPEQTKQSGDPIKEFLNQLSDQELETETPEEFLARLEEEEAEDEASEEDMGGDQLRSAA